MKIISLFTLLFGFTVLATAQITDSKIVYEMKMSSDNPELEMQLAMMDGSSLEMIIYGDLTKQTVAIGGFMTTTTISDAKRGETLTLMDGMMGKIAMSINDEDKPKEEEGESADIEIELVDETKEILGYTCHKALIIDSDGNESIFWYSKEIQSPKTESQYFQSELPGLPLEFIIVSQDVTMQFIATEFSKKLKKEDKEINLDIPEGYTEMSPEEMQNSFGQ